MNDSELCRVGDDEPTVRAALVDDFDDRWPAMAASIRRQVLAAGGTLKTALEIAETIRPALRAEQADMAPTLMDRVAAEAGPTH